MFVDVGSMVNLTCVVANTEKPPGEVKWIHEGREISFRGPRNGVSVSSSFSINSGIFTKSSHRQGKRSAKQSDLLSTIILFFLSRKYSRRKTKNVLQEYSSMFK